MQLHALVTYSYGESGAKKLGREEADWFLMMAISHVSPSFLQLTELNDLLTSVGQHERAAIIQYKSACVTKDLEARTRRIKALIQNSFNGHPGQFRMSLR